MRNPRKLAPGTIYICGPVTGKPDNNVKEFAQAEEKINSLGFNTLNPLDIFQDVNTEGFDHSDYMKHCGSFLSMCDYVVTLNEWEYSKGANQEVNIANILGKRVVHISKFLHDHDVKS